VDDIARFHNFNEHAFGVDDDPLWRIPVPSPVPRAGQFNQALPGHSCRAPKECLTTKPVYSSARCFHDGKISGYSSTRPEKLSDDEEVNP
jgi:hypothetical protein